MFVLLASVDIHLYNATIVLPFRQRMFVASLSAGRRPAVMNVFAFQAKVSRWIENFDCDGYFCIRECFCLEKPNFHKELQVTNFELRMRSSALFNLRLSTWTYLFFFSQINADLFLADSRWFIFCAHLRFQSATICVNCFFWIFSPTPKYSPKLFPS